VAASVVAPAAAGAGEAVVGWAQETTAAEAAAGWARETTVAVAALGWVAREAVPLGGVMREGTALMAVGTRVKEGQDRGASTVGACEAASTVVAAEPKVPA